MNGRGALRAISLAVVVAACSPAAPVGSVVSPTPSSMPSLPASPGLDPTASPQTAAPTTAPTVRPSPTEVPAESVWSQRPPEPLLIGAAVRVIAGELNIREEPSTSAKRVTTFRAGLVILVSTLPPVDAEGYTWYRGTGPFGEGEGELPALPNPAEDPRVEAAYGWFAARKGAVQYVEPATTRCPAVVDLENLGAMVPAERLECFGGRTLEFEGTYGCPGCIPEVYGTYEPGWLADPNEVNLVTVVGRRDSGLGLNLRFRPEDDGRPETGSIIRVRGHFDDPLSAGCSIALVPWDYRVMVPHVVPGSIANLWCRQMFVVESYEVVGPDTSFGPEFE